MSVFSYFNIFKKIRAVSNFLSFNEKEWDKPVDISFSQAEYSLLQEWVETIMRNKAVSIIAGKKETPKTADAHIVLDASEWGWGAIYFNEKKEYVTFENNKWDSNDYKSSVKAEPAAATQAIHRWKHLLRNKTVAIHTDHENLEYASKALRTLVSFQHLPRKTREGVERTKHSIPFLFSTGHQEYIGWDITREQRPFRKRKDISTR